MTKLTVYYKNVGVSHDIFVDTVAGWSAFHVWGGENAGTSLI